MNQTSPFSFSDFNAVAHIDYITLARPPGFNSWHKKALREAHEQGRVEFPSTGQNSRVTIHDPSKKDLQRLLDAYWAVEIAELEISIDFKPRTSERNQPKLTWLHHVLTTCLYPEAPGDATPSMQGKWKRKYYDLQTRQYKPDNLATKAGNRTVKWEKRRGGEQIRLYIKGVKEGWPVENQFVRLEATLNRKGCQTALVHRLALLLAFMAQSRQYLSPLFQVADGIKPTIKRVRSNNPSAVEAAALEAKVTRVKDDKAWERYGAAWAVKHKRKLSPHTQANRVIGEALKGLREQLMTLELPAKVAENPSLLADFRSIYQPLIRDSRATL
jgi:hypothetical protein